MMRRNMIFFVLLCGFLWAWPLTDGSRFKVYASDEKTPDPVRCEEKLQAKDHLIQSMKKENVRLRKKISQLIEENTFLNENLMNCMAELQEMEERKSGN